MNLDDFSYEENGRRYINPQVALDEENSFIQNLRDTQTQDNAKIYQDTHNLGTDVPSNIGGLNGGEAYFNARYQTPQTNKTISDLRATAQAKALSDALDNEVAKAKKRYQDAYYAARDKANSNTTGGGNNDDEKKNEPEHENTADPAKTDPNGTDTVEQHSENGQQKKADQAKTAQNNFSNLTGGGQLPMGYQSKKAYLVSPDGRWTYEIYTVKGPTGQPYWAAPINESKNGEKPVYMEYQNDNASAAHQKWGQKVKEFINKGYRVRLAPDVNSRDVTDTYYISLYWY